VLAIALANKLARIAWSVLHHGRDFEVRKISEPMSQPRVRRPRHRAPELAASWIPATSAGMTLYEPSE
jgi:hypothetical protein